MYDWFVRWSLNHPHQRHIIEGALCAGAGAVVKFAADYLGAGHVDGLSDSLALAAGGVLLLLSKNLRDRATQNFLDEHPAELPPLNPTSPVTGPVVVVEPPVVPHG